MRQSIAASACGKALYKSQPGEAAEGTVPTPDGDTDVDPRTDDKLLVPRGIPTALERSEVPHYFRQFKNAAVLKKLAHTGKGPLYQLIGKNAWYDTVDIVAWLSSRKRSGPPRPLNGMDPPLEAAPPASGMGKRRGRPTKAAVWLRKQANDNTAEDA